MSVEDAHAKLNGANGTNGHIVEDGPLRNRPFSIMLTPDQFASFGLSIRSSHGPALTACAQSGPT